MNFDEFQRMNADRCNTKFHSCDAWTPSDWALAIAGEAGELCNVLKKVNRGDYSVDAVRSSILKECADIITYVDLLMTRLDASTEVELLNKFDEVSARVGYKR